MYQPYPGSTQMPEMSIPSAPGTVLFAVGTVLFAVGTGDMFAGLTAPIAGPVKIWAILIWLAGLAAVVSLWRRSSSAFFRARPA
ncbi:MAG: hypothetical protein M3Z75_18460 [Actinomycetota bacterium]|nr:hypothetical protein [Actinomycetota bacterium]